jgi:hypothetical protein
LKQKLFASIFSLNVLLMQKIFLFYSFTPLYSCLPYNSINFFSLNYTLNYGSQLDFVHEEKNYLFFLLFFCSKFPVLIKCYNLETQRILPAQSNHKAFLCCIKQANLLWNSRINNCMKMANRMFRVYAANFSWNKANSDGEYMTQAISL